MIPAKLSTLKQKVHSVILLIRSVLGFTVVGERQEEVCVAQERFCFRTQNQQNVYPELYLLGVFLADLGTNINVVILITCEREALRTLHTEEFLLKFCGSPQYVISGYGLFFALDW